MVSNPTITFIIGTRPEAIKLAPVILEFNNSNQFNTRIVLTGQHQSMVRQVMDFFNLIEDANLKIMKKKQSLSYLTSNTLLKLEKEFKKTTPDMVIVQGDTSAAFSGGLTAFYLGIPVGHVEAGLRTFDNYQPFPEEVNRKMISQYASLHFAPTDKAKENLISSGIKEDIYVTGNTVVDALLYAEKNIKEHLFQFASKSSKIILTTIHRRENWGRKYEELLIAVREIVQRNKSVIIIFPMHKNPDLRMLIHKLLDNHPRIVLTESLSYVELVSAIKNSFLILTDSGGLQEEGPTFGKPVLILREKTERQEGLEYGVTKLIGTNKENIIKEVEKLLRSKDSYNKMSKKINPFGNGDSSNKILTIVKSFFNL